MADVFMHVVGKGNYGFILRFVSVIFLNCTD